MAISTGAAGRSDEHNIMGTGSARQVGVVPRDEEPIEQLLQGRTRPPFVFRAWSARSCRQNTPRLQDGASPGGTTERHSHSVSLRSMLHG
jgi:hypothetical protein